MEEKLLGREEESFGKEFLACINCLKVIPVIPEGVKEEIQSEMPGIFIEEDDFMVNHKDVGHKIVSLWVVDFFSERPHFEPVKEGWYQTQSEKGERFIVKKSRTKIEEPFTFELFRGRVKKGVEEISLQEESIKKQLRWEKPAWPEEKLEEIIEILRGVFEIERESIVDKLHKQFSSFEKNGFLANTEHPLRFLLGLSPEFVGLLSQSVRPICSPEEWSFISQFIKQNQGPDGLLAVQVKMRFRPVIIAK